MLPRTTENAVADHIWPVGRYFPGPGLRKSEIEKYKQPLAVSHRVVWRQNCRKWTVWGRFKIEYVNLGLATAFQFQKLIRVGQPCYVYWGRANETELLPIHCGSRVEVAV